MLVLIWKALRYHSSPGCVRGYHSHASPLYSILHRCSGPITSQHANCIRITRFFYLLIARYYLVSAKCTSIWLLLVEMLNWRVSLCVIIITGMLRPAFFFVINDVLKKYFFVLDKMSVSILNLRKLFILCFYINTK